MAGLLQHSKYSNFGCAAFAKENAYEPSVGHAETYPILCGLRYAAGRGFPLRRRAGLSKRAAAFSGNGSRRKKPEASPKKRVIGAVAGTFQSAENDAADGKTFYTCFLESFVEMYLFGNRVPEKQIGGGGRVEIQLEIAYQLEILGKAS